MNDSSASREELLEELADLHRKISEQEAVDDKLRKANALLENVFSTDTLLIAYMDAGFNFIRVNRKYADADNRTPEFFPGKNHFDLYPNKENEAIFRRVVETGKPYSTFAKEFVYPQDIERGITFWDWSLFPIKDPEGTVEALILFVVDVTERFRAEAKLARQRNIFNSMLSSSSDLIFMKDRNAVFIAANPAFCRYVGMSEEELVGKATTELFPGPEGEQYTRDDMHVMEERTTLVQDEKSAIPGEDKWYQVVKNPVFDEHGEVSGIICILRDITERKKAEDNLKRSVHEKELLLREMHHRTKNNLMVIQSLLKLQSRQINDTESRAVFTESQDRVKSLTMIHERLYRSRDLKSIDFSDYIRSLVKELFQGYRQRDRNVRLIFDMDEISIDIDTMIPCGLIVNELVTNALKYAFPRGERGELSIQLRRSEDLTTLVIKDTGTGLPEGLDIYKTESLGLQIVTSLIKQLDGTLEVGREGGTEFRIAFKPKY